MSPSLSYAGDVLLNAVERGLSSFIRRYLEREFRPALLDYHRESDGYTALHVAAETGRSELALLLLRAGAEVDALDLRKRTPLVAAAVAGKEQIVKILLDRKANTHLVPDDEQTILLHVVKHAEDSRQHAHVVGILLDTAIDPNTLGSSKRAALHLAALKGHLEITTTLVRHSRTDPNVKGKWDWNALHYLSTASTTMRARIAEVLIRYGTDPTGRDSDGWLPLHLASESGDVELMKMLVQDKPSSVALRATDGRNALHFGFGQPDSLKWLLAERLEIDAKDDDGYTALMFAAGRGSEDSVRVLLENDADMKITRKNGRTALHQAAYFGQLKTAQLLLDKDASMLSCRDHNNLSALHLAITESEEEFVEVLLNRYHKNTADGTAKDLAAETKDDSETVLISAVKGRQYDAIRKLRELGAATQHADNSGKTALLWAVNKGDIEGVSALLDDSADTRADANASGGKYPTALYEAARFGDMGVVKALLKYKARIDVQGGQFNTALSAAASEGNIEIFDHLLASLDVSERSAAVNLSGGVFANTLGAALYSYTVELVRPLLEVKVDINGLDDQGRSSFHIAAARGLWAELDVLCQVQGAEFYRRDKQKRMLLHHAAMSGSESMVLSLLNDKRFALSTDEEDIDGWTPLHWACRQDHVRVVETLLDRQKAAVDISKSDSWFISRATKDGWTPQNISIVHGATQVANFFQQRLLKAEQESYKSRLVSSSVEKRPRKGRKWKAWTAARSRAFCDGCFLKASSNLCYFNFIFRRLTCSKKPLVGVRWHCQDCQDFDYCFKCFWTAKSTHDSKHVFEPFPDWEEARNRRETETEDDDDDDEADVRSQESDDFW